MFRKLCAVATLLPLATATITFSIPPGITSGGTLNLTWSSSPGDPSVFSLELNNPRLFRNALAVANNVPTSNGAIVVDLPIVDPADDYTLEAVDPSNINSIFGNSSVFSIGATVSTTSSTASSTASLSSASGSSSSAASSGSVSATSPASGVSTRTTNFVTATSSVASAASAGSNSASGTNTASGSSSTPFNGNGASGVKANLLSVGSIAAAALGVVAGVVGFAA